MTELDHRVTKLEDWKSSTVEDVTELKTKVGHIETDMSDMKEIAKTNTQANVDGLLKHSDTNLILAEMYAFVRGAAWVLGIIITISGIAVAFI